MVRYCIIENCTETDVTVLAHRFPKKLDHRIKWQEALNLQDHDLNVLYNKYVVCLNHFKPSDYRNQISKHLNSTAIPHLPKNSRKSQTQAEAETELSSSTVEIVEVTEDEANDTVSQLPKLKRDPQYVPYGKVSNSTESEPTNQTPEMIEIKTVFAQRRRKRTNQEIGEEIKELTEAAIKKLKGTLELVPRSPSPVVVLLSDENVLTDHNPEEDQTTSNNVTTAIVNLESEVSDLIEVVIAEVACQTEDLEEKDDSEFGSLSRTELVKLLKEKDQTIETLQQKINKFEAAMSAFKVLMNPLG